MPGDLGCTCGDYARVLPSPFARETMGATRTRHSPRPLIYRRAGRFPAKLAHARRDREAVSAVVLKFEPSCVVPAKAGTHTPRPYGETSVLDAFYNNRRGGYGSLLSQGRQPGDHETRRASRPPIKNPVLSREHAPWPYRLDKHVTGQRRRAVQMIDRPVPPRGALNLRHARAAQPRVAFQRGRDGCNAFSNSSTETFGQYGGVLDRHCRALRGERQHGVDGVAQQRDRASSPFAALGEGEQRPFAPVVDGADHHPRGPRPLGWREHGLDFVGLARRAPA